MGKPALVAAMILMLPTTAMAEWVHATGTYLFPPIMPEAEACQYAEERARTEAIRQVTGETVSSEDTLRCTEQGEEVECARNLALWSTMDGYIRDQRNRTIATRASAAGHRECVVALEADVRAAQGRPDSSFDLGVSTNQPVFRDGEHLVVSLSPSQPMAVQVFQWLPYLRDDAAVRRLFPNAFDNAQLIDKATTVPSETGSKRYDMRLAFPQDMPPGRKMVDEYLVIVATRQPLVLRDSYSLDDFRRLLAEIPRDQGRIIRKAYNIVRGNR